MYLKCTASPNINARRFYREREREGEQASLLLWSHRNILNDIHNNIHENIIKAFFVIFVVFVKSLGPLACLAAALGPLACLAAALGPLACLAAALGHLAWLN